MAAPVVESVSTVATASASTSVTTNAPSGVAVGDLLILMISTENAITLGAQTGWTIREQRVGPSSNNAVIVLDRIADGTATDTPTITHTSSVAHWIACMLRVSGAGSFDVSADYGSSSNIATIEIPSVVVAEDDSLAVAIGCHLSTSGSLSFPAAWTEHYEATNDHRSAGGTRTVASGTYTAENITISSSKNRRVSLIAVWSPAASGGPEEVNAANETITWTTNQADISVPSQVDAGTKSLNWQTNQADISVPSQVDGNAASIGWQTQQANITQPHVIAANLQEARWNTLRATIFTGDEQPGGSGLPHGYHPAYWSMQGGIPVAKSTTTTMKKASPEQRWGGQGKTLPSVRLPTATKVAQGLNIKKKVRVVVEGEVAGVTADGMEPNMAEVQIDMNRTRIVDDSDNVFSQLDASFDQDD